MMVPMYSWDTAVHILRDHFIVLEFMGSGEPYGITKHAWQSGARWSSPSHSRISDGSNTREACGRRFCFESRYITRNIMD